MERREAFWDIDYDSGERYRFGDVTFQGSQIREEYLQNLVPFKEGDYYSSRDLAELNRRLSATGWFNSVVVAPEFSKGRQTKVLPLSAVMSPRTENTIETGVGYSTDVGPRLKGTWKNRGSTTAVTAWRPAPTFPRRNSRSISAIKCRC